jgi:hypothetical protein
MPSKKQIQYRLESKKTKLNKVTRDVANAEKGKQKILLRKLTQEKGSLDRDIKRLERQLIMEIKASKEKKALNL